MLYNRAWFKKDTYGLTIGGGRGAPGVAVAAQFGPGYGLPRAYSRHQNHWYWGAPPQVYKNLIVIQWSFEDVRDNCTSFQAFEYYQRFGMGEENAAMYLCRGVTFDIQKVWSHSHLSGCGFGKLTPGQNAPDPISSSAQLRPSWDQSPI